MYSAQLQIQKLTQNQCYSAKSVKILLEDQNEILGTRKLMSETHFAILYCLKKVFSYIRMKYEKAV